MHKEKLLIAEELAFIKEKDGKSNTSVCKTPVQQCQISFLINHYNSTDCTEAKV